LYSVALVFGINLSPASSGGCCCGTAVFEAALVQCSRNSHQMQVVRRKLQIVQRDARVPQPQREI
jgi:hypothetical protein